MTLTEILTQLQADGWFVKISTAQKGPDPCWRVWLSWRLNEPPHKEESRRCDTLDEVAAWLETTRDNWRYDDDDS